MITTQQQVTQPPLFNPSGYISVLLCCWSVSGQRLNAEQPQISPDLSELDVCISVSEQCAVKKMHEASVDVQQAVNAKNKSQQWHAGSFNILLVEQLFNRQCYSVRVLTGKQGEALRLTIRVFNTLYLTNTTQPRNQFPFVLIILNWFSFKSAERCSEFRASSYSKIDNLQKFHHGCKKNVKTGLMRGVQILLSVLPLCEVSVKCSPPQMQEGAGGGLQEFPQLL